MTRTALCVGINEFAHLPMSSWLAGCVNDAEDIAAALRKRGFSARRTRILTDEAATKEAVLGRLTEMVDGAKDGDHLFFSFSSHGTQVTDLDGDEKVDQLDEAFACYDIKSAGTDWDSDTVILDDELKALFGRIPKGVLVEVVMDTCHSGTGLRRITDLQHDLLLGRRPRFIPPPSRRAATRSLDLELRSQDNGSRDHKGLVELSAARRGASRPVLFAACKPYQTASDATFDGRANGAFTHLFLKALKATPDASRTELLKAVTAGLKAERFDQRSTLEGAVAAKKVPFGQPW